MQSRGLKQNGNSAETYDHVHLTAIELDDLAGIVFNVGARDKGHTFTQGFARTAQHG